MSDTPIFSFSVFGNRFYFTPKFIKTTFITVLILIGLGNWQLHVADAAKKTLDLINNRSAISPVPIENLTQNDDWNFYPIQVTGQFDNEHQILLTHREYQGNPGYFVVTPLKLLNSSLSILVNRGWVPIGKNPEGLPDLSPVAKTTMVAGYLFKPPLIDELLNDMDEHNISWPLLSKHVDIDKISRSVGYPLQPYMILMDPANDAGFVRNWTNYTAHLNPDRNRLNALQWFFLAGLIIVIFVYMNTQRG